MLRLIMAFSFFISTTAYADNTKCSPTDLQNLYKGALQTLCSVNYVFNLTGVTKEPNERLRNDLALCAITLAGVGGVASMTALASDLADEELRNGKSLISNTKEGREYYQKKTERYRPNGKYNMEAYKYQDIVKAMKDSPNNHILISNSLMYDATPKKGPNKYVYNSVKMGGKVAGAVMGAALSGGVFVAAEVIFGANPGGCSEAMDSYVFRQAGSTCTPDKRLSPQVMNFLNLPQKEQETILKEYPGLCQAYADISNNIEAEMKKRYSYKATGTACSGSALSTKLEFTDKVQSEVRVSGDTATMYVNDTTYKVEYAKNEYGQRVLKSIVGESKITDKVYGPSYQYTFPPKSDQVRSKLFKKALAEVSRQTLALEKMKAFSQCDSASGSKAGATTTR